MLSVIVHEVTMHLIWLCNLVYVIYSHLIQCHLEIIATFSQPRLNEWTYTSKRQTGVPSGVV